MAQIFDRIKLIITQPKAAWVIIKEEKSSNQELVINYAAPLALLPVICLFIGLVVIGLKTPSGHIARAPLAEALSGGILNYVFQLASLLAIGWCVNFLAPYFNAKPDYNSALKLVVYAMTPVWLAGLFSIMPSLMIFQGLLSLYSWYLLFTGIPVLMEAPKDNVILYSVLTIVAALFIGLVVSVIIGSGIYGPMFIRMMAA